MTRTPDPQWIAVADQIFSFCLWLYPSALRRAHGDEMRQVFRERCREVARGERGAFALFALELLPDTLRSASSEQMAATFDEMRPRQIAALLLLIVSASGLLLHERLSRVVLDGVFELKYGLRNVMEARDLAQREAQVRKLAERMLLRGDAEDTALAAYLFRALYSGRQSLYEYPEDRGGSPQLGKLPPDGDRAAVATATVFADHPSAYTLAVALQACIESAGCNRQTGIDRLTAMEPDNAYAWSIAFGNATASRDPLAMRASLERMAQTSYFQDYQGRINHDLFAAARASAPGDDALAMAIGQQLVLARGQLRYWDHARDVMIQCTPRIGVEASYVSRWVDKNADGLTLCLRVAQVFTSSTDPVTARWGWRFLIQHASEPDVRQLALSKFRDSDWLLTAGSTGWSRMAEGNAWSEWTADDWRRWAGSWAATDDETTAMQQTLLARHQPLHAPTTFQAQLP